MVPAGYIVDMEHGALLYSPSDDLGKAVNRITGISKEFPPAVPIFSQEEAMFLRTRFLPGLRKVNESKKSVPTVKFR